MAQMVCARAMIGDNGAITGVIDMARPVANVRTCRARMPSPV